MAVQRSQVLSSLAQFMQESQTALGDLGISDSVAGRVTNNSLAKRSSETTESTEGIRPLEFFNDNQTSKTLIEAIPGSSIGENFSSSLVGSLVAIKASTWSGLTTINSVSEATPEIEVAVILQARQVERNTPTATGSWLRGGNRDDIIRGLAGWDILDGGNGNDLIRAGNGRDIITGGLGSDELHGDFGWNTYTSERDGSVDLIVIKSDQYLVNRWYGQSGNSPNGEKADILEGLDPYDQIRIVGIATQDITVAPAASRGVNGMGIFARGTLEALYIGGDLSNTQLEAMITGDSSPAAMANQIWSYWHGNEAPPLIS